MVNILNIIILFFLTILIDPKILHEGVICDRCNGEIYGIRFMCCHCDDYDLCQSCEETLLKDKFHDHRHIFLQIFTPILPRRKLPPYKLQPIYNTKAAQVLVITRLEKLIF